MDYSFDDFEENSSYSASMWSEKIFVITEDYEIRGHVFLSKTGKKSRALTELLNGPKRFIAIKDCEIRFRKPELNYVEKQSFIQLNISSIILLRPLNETE